MDDYNREAVAHASRNEPLTWLKIRHWVAWISPPRSAADLAEAFRELGAGRETIVLCQKSKRESATQFVRCSPKKQERKQPVPALDAVAAKLPADSGSDPKKAVPALLSALGHEDPLVRAVASKFLKRIDPEVAKKAGVR